MAETLLQELIEGLRVLPGVGPKSAQRMALHLLQREREAAERLGAVLQRAMVEVQHCDVCRNFTEHAVCELCSDEARDASQLCVVESPADVLALERSTDYKGRYFVLMGHLSPLDGVGPAELGLDRLAQLFDQQNIKEVTLATNPTVEGSATANYISDMANKREIRVLQIARGIPVGGELEFADGSTLSVAFSDRTQVN